MRCTLRKLRSVAGTLPADQFGPKALREVRDAMLETAWGRSTTNRRVSMIVRAFKYAVSEEVVGPHIVHALECVEHLRYGEAHDGQKVRPVPDADIAAIEEHVASVIWDMVQVQLCTGMRPGEVCCMWGVDIDTSGSVRIYHPSQHKTQHHGHE